VCIYTLYKNLKTREREQEKIYLYYKYEWDCYRKNIAGWKNMVNYTTCWVSLLLAKNNLSRIYRWYLAKIVSLYNNRSFVLFFFCLLIFILLCFHFRRRNTSSYSTKKNSHFFSSFVCFFNYLVFIIFFENKSLLEFLVLCFYFL